MNEFDKELERIINHAIVRDNTENNPLGVDNEAVEAIKQAIEKHVIGKDEEVTRIDRKVDDDVSKESRNSLRTEQRQKLHQK